MWMRDVCIKEGHKRRITDNVKLFGYNNIWYKINV